MRNKTIITLVKGPPLRRVLCSFLCGAAAFCVLPTNGQAPADIVWVTSGYSIGKYSTDGTTAIPNFITEPSVITSVILCPNLPPSITHPRNAGYLGAILVSGHTLYVDTEEGGTWPCLQYLMYHTYPFTYIIATYNAGTGNVINFPFFGWRNNTKLSLSQPGPVPVGMALSGTNLYVATNVGISKLSTTGGGNASFATPTLTAPYALAVGGPNGNTLYVTNNSRNSNGDFYISTYTADTGALINANFIQIQIAAGLNGLAIKPADASTPDTLYVSVIGGSPDGVYTYTADTGQLIKGPFVSVNAPWGIAIGSPRIPGGHPTLYVASHADSAIYEFDAIKGGQPFGSIKMSSFPTNITVEPAAAVNN